jgi:hypothetical protein
MHDNVHEVLRKWHDARRYDEEASYYTLTRVGAENILDEYDALLERIKELETELQDLKWECDDQYERTGWTPFD